MVIIKTSFIKISEKTEGYKIKFIRFFPILSDSYSLLRYNRSSRLLTVLPDIFYVNVRIYIRYIYMHTCMYIYTYMHNLLC